MVAQAQVSVPTQAQQVKVDDLTDDQVRQIVDEMRKNKMTLDQVNIYASQKGISATEANKLKTRIKDLNLDKELVFTKPPESHSTGRGINMEEMTYESDGREKSVATGQKHIFGAELFSNRNLTFEPNLRMPTPPNYRLAASDEILIDVYGYSEVQHNLTVSPEGYIRIPNIGPVYVNGLTMSEAKNRITKQLATIYNGINAGNTFVQVSLGSIRSIQVLLIGEVVRPGTYTLPSLASIANALYVSGGPNGNGSFRDIQVLRGGSQVARFDLYDFITNGDLTNNIILQDQDIVKVNPYKIRVELEGQVKRPAIFEAKPGETLQTIINYAGGFTDKAYRDQIRATRIAARERQIITVPGASAGSFELRSGDQYFVDAILDRFSNRVSITGAIFHPGDYALEPDMSLADLIKRADGLMEVASLSRGIIRRLQDDYTQSILNFNVKDVISGQEKILLRREDSVVIFSKLQLREKFNVKISGLVNNPGYFDYADSMKLEDLILMAGGLKEAASLKRLEISRRLRGKEYDPNDTAIAIVQQFEIRSDLRSTPEVAHFLLEPFDEISVRKSPTYYEQSNVEINGEVVYAGTYSINSNKERISDLLRRAGGLKSGAYPEGAVMLRKTFVNESDSVLLSYKLEVYNNKLKDSTDVSKTRSDIFQKDQIIGIKLNEIIRSPGSKYDLYLEEGDVIKIPKQLQTVQLFGEVYFPKKVRFDKNIRFRDYIRGAGGFTTNALKRRSYIVYANGDVKGARKLFFFNSYPRVRPGSEIYVPKKGEKKSFTTQEAIGITTGLASIALIVVSILNLSNK